MIRRLTLTILSHSESGALLSIRDETGEEAQLRFHVQRKQLWFETDNPLTDLLRCNEQQLRRLLHNKRPDTFYPGFHLPFSLLVGKDVAAFNDRDNVIVVDSPAGKILTRPKSKRGNLTVVYTDGSYNEARKRGGIAILIRRMDGTETLVAETTPSRSSSLIELEAVIRALEIIPGDVRIVTDSQYVRKGIAEWMIHWRHNGWKTANGRLAKNVVQWQKLDRLIQDRVIELEWVKGHFKHRENMICDQASREVILGKEGEEMKKSVAFVCTHNSCRSQMAEGFARSMAGDWLDVYSAGTEEYPEVKPLAVQVMEEIGIDMSEHRPKLISDIPESVDYLITMGCGVVCPFVPSSHEEDWGLDDPSGGPIEDFRDTRELIRAKMEDFLERIRREEI